MKIAKNITSIFLIFMYIMPISINIGDLFTHIDNCDIEESCCVVEVEKSCCNEKEESHPIHNEKQCNDSIFCQYCLENCTIQSALNSEFNIGFNVIQNITFTVIPNVVISNVISINSLKEKDIPILSYSPEIKIFKTIHEFISPQYFSSNIG